jgi:hypothetical protein
MYTNLEGEPEWKGQLKKSYPMWDINIKMDLKGIE